MFKLELLPNKIIALVFVLCGIVPLLLEGDGTVLVVFGPIALMTFFAKENWTCIQVCPREEEENEAIIIRFPEDEDTNNVSREMRALHGRG